MSFTDKEYWQKQYKTGKTGWNIGYISPPIKTYIDQLTDKNLTILIPGAGNAYEAEYLFEKGFTNVFVLDIVKFPLENFLKRFPEFPENQIIKDDFFKHEERYDLIFEQTFFSALPVEKRSLYVEKVYELLKPNGKLVGLLFDRDFDSAFPPFGGNKEVYQNLFSKKFHLKVLEKAYNSIKPRHNNELFIIFEKL